MEEKFLQIEPVKYLQLPFSLKHRDPETGREGGGVKGSGVGRKMPDLFILFCYSSGLFNFQYLRTYYAVKLIAKVVLVLWADLLHGSFNARLFLKETKKINKV